MKEFNKTLSRRDRGFTLIEVLVALLVLGIGLLGLAALQTRGVRFNHDAYTRSQATVLAYEIIDRMRINRDDADLYMAADPGNVCNLSASDVDNDLSCWYDNLAATLPAGTGQITTNAADNRMYDVVVMWQERSGRDPSTQAECEHPDLPSRQWDPVRSLCLVTQTWTVWP